MLGGIWIFLDEVNHLRIFGASYDYLKLGIVQEGQFEHIGGYEMFIEVNY